MTGLTGVTQVAAGGLQPGPAVRRHGVGLGRQRGRPAGPRDDQRSRGHARPGGGLPASPRSRPGAVSSWRCARTAPCGPGATTGGQLGNGTTAAARCRSRSRACPRSPGSRRAGTPWPRDQRHLRGHLGVGLGRQRRRAARRRHDGRHATPERVTGLRHRDIAGRQSPAGGLRRQFAAILGTDGSVWAWGADTSASWATRHPHPGDPAGEHHRGRQRDHPALRRRRHMLALKSDGTVLAWGDNASASSATAPGTRHRPGAGHRPDRRHAGGRRVVVQLRGPPVPYLVGL